MKIVFLTNTFHPNYSANAKCIANLIDLLKYNNTIRVISINDKCSWYETEINNHFLYQVSTKRLSKRKRIHDNINTTSSNFCKKFYNIFLSYYRVKHIIKIILSKYTLDKQLVDSYYNALIKFKDDIEILIPTCNPVECVLAAQHFKRNFSNNNIILAPYLFDKFSNNRYLHYFYLNYKIKFKFNLDVERKIFVESDLIIVNKTWSDHIVNFFPQYKEKSLFVEHPLLKKRILNTNNVYHTEHLNILYAGILNKKIRPPQYVIKVFKKIIDKNNKIYLNLYVRGNCNNIINRSIKKHRKNIINHGYVNNEKIEKEMKNSTHLLLIGNNDITQLQSKVFEYMSYGKPIILFYRKSLDPVIEILRKYPLKCILNQQKNNFNENIKILEAFLVKSRDKYIDYDKIENIYFESTPKFVSERLISKIVSINKKAND